MNPSSRACYQAAPGGPRRDRAAGPRPLRLFRDRRPPAFRLAGRGAARLLPRAFCVRRGAWRRARLKHGEPDVLNWSWHEYGNRVGVRRMLDLLDALKLPCAALVNSKIYDHCPSVLAAFRARGDEIVTHGRSNAERQGDLDEPAERALIAEATRVLTRAEGRAPRGWLGTVDLAEQGHALSAGAQRHSGDHRPQGRGRRLLRHGRGRLRGDARPVRATAAGVRRRAAPLSLRPAAPAAPLAHRPAADRTTPGKWWTTPPRAIATAYADVEAAGERG